MRISPLPWMTSPETRAVMDVLNRDGDMARFVGGCVRSAVLHLPIADIDIATRLTPEKTTELLKDAGIRVVPTGLQHGTVTAVINHEHFEITTLRLDVETDGRRAIVAFTEDWKEDAARRDFTMNAMFLRPDGTLEDPFGGHGDALSGRVRFVGDPATRIQEDVLRILRFFRFHAHFGKDGIDPVGLKACADHAGLIESLSGERIGAEFLKLLAAPDPVSVLEVMESAGILQSYLPGPYDPTALTRLIAFEPAVADPILRLAAFAPEVPEQAFRASARMRFSNADATRFTRLSGRNLEEMPDAPAMRRQIYIHGNALFEDLVRLAYANGDLEQERAQDLIARSQDWPKPDLPLRGADLVKMGIAAGPGVGDFLRKIETWWIERDFSPGHEECLAEVHRIAGKE
ncbi:CCA tRNA nucleotidyltransferase [Nisaea nitritireducens]|uniref:CCA tRNA nucleotidyltransferase n=1 Tax=Nisaea nitritireducens TaxID=568392 RepID=UPI001867FB5B|nr:CCA tRNA nucleotidyltransferase [Nisaea nitritireducens]